MKTERILAGCPWWDISVGGIYLSNYSHVLGIPRPGTSKTWLDLASLAKRWLPFPALILSIRWRIPPAKGSDRIEFWPHSSAE